MSSIKTETHPKILFLDIELAPNLATVWDIWNQNIGLNQLLETSYVLCWSAKWKGQKTVMFDSVMKSSKVGVIKSVWKLLDEADIVCHYNGKRFDIPTLNKEFLLQGMKPPRPYQQIDLYKTIKSKFRFVSNKLAHVTKQLGFEGKIKTDHQLWLDCMNNNKTAWNKMEKYNRRDVTELEKLYNVLVPWITDHPNIAVYNDNLDTLLCSNCGSNHLQSRGTHINKSNRYRRFQCQKCGTWLKAGLTGKNIIISQIRY